MLSRINANLADLRGVRTYKNVKCAAGITRKIKDTGEELRNEFYYAWEKENNYEVKFIIDDEPAVQLDELTATANNHDGIKKMEAGQNHWLALTGDGQVISWGDNRYGQLGRNDEKLYDFVEINKEKKAKTIACTLNSSLVLIGEEKDQELFAWGSNRWGELGILGKFPKHSTSTSDEGSKEYKELPIPVKLKDLIPVEDYIESIHANRNSFYAFTRLGRLIGWGRNWCAEIGIKINGRIEPSQIKFENEFGSNEFFLDFATGHEICAAITCSGLNPKGGPIEHIKMRYEKSMNQKTHHINCLHTLWVWGKISASGDKDLDKDTIKFIPVICETQKDSHQFKLTPLGHAIAVTVYTNLAEGMRAINDRTHKIKEPFVILNGGSAELNSYQLPDIKNFLNDACEFDDRLKFWVEFKF